MATKPLAPSAKIVKDARPVHVITDALGRSISYRTLSVLEQARLTRAVGAEHSANLAFLQFAMMAVAVLDIDGIPMPQPKSLLQVDAAIDRLGDDGYTAMYEALHNTKDEGATVEDEVAAAKN